MAYEEMLAYEAVNVAYAFNPRTSKAIFSIVVQEWVNLTHL